MKTIKDIRALDFAIRQYKELQGVARTLHKLNENECNYGLSKSQRTRESNLVSKAEELAKTLGLHAYHQGDPRGCSLWLIEENSMTQKADINYINGIAVY